MIASAPDARISGAANSVALAAPPWRPSTARIWRASDRRAVLLVGDLFCVTGAMLITQTAIPTTSLEPGLMAVWIGLLGAVWLTTAAVTRYYDQRAARGFVPSVARAVTTALASYVAYALIPFWSPSLPSARWMIAYNIGLMLFGLAAWRGAYLVLLAQRAARVRTLVLAQDEATDAVAALLASGQVPDYELVGVVPAPGDGRAVALTDLVDLVAAHDAGELVVGSPRLLPRELQAGLVQLAEMGVQVSTAGRLYAALTGRVLSRSADLDWFITLEYPSRVYGAIRRTVEVVLAVVTLAALSPLVLLACAAIVIESPGSPFFFQTRVGQFGRSFRVVKLRSMVLDAEPGGRAVWAAHADKRITRVGRFLRRSRIDEIPQLWNVLRGDMSFIGPRPERPEFTAMLSIDLPMYGARHVVRPGITGWSQVRFGYGSSVDDAATKLEYDLYYIWHRSFALDVTIVVETVGVVLGMRGR